MDVAAAAADGSAEGNAARSADASPAPVAGWPVGPPVVVAGGSAAGCADRARQTFWRAAILRTARRAAGGARRFVKVRCRRHAVSVVTNEAASWTGAGSGGRPGARRRGPRRVMVDSSIVGGAL